MKKAMIVTLCWVGLVQAQQPGIQYAAHPDRIAAIVTKWNAKSSVTWEPYVSMGSQLFPSFAIATSTLQTTGAMSPYYLGDRNGLVGISIISPSDDADIKLQVTIPDIAEPSTFEGVLQRGRKEL